MAKLKRQFAQQFAGKRPASDPACTQQAHDLEDRHKHFFYPCLTHQMTHQFGSDKIAGMSVLAGILAFLLNVFSPLFFTLFYFFKQVCQKRVNSLAETVDMACSLRADLFIVKTQIL
jgi:hypothetical protein